MRADWLPKIYLYYLSMNVTRDWSEYEYCVTAYLYTVVRLYEIGNVRFYIILVLKYLLITFSGVNVELSLLQGVSQLTVIYNIQNTQIWVITEKKILTFHYHRNITFHLKVSQDTFNHILCPKM